MDKELLKILCCPECKGELELSGSLENGKLICKKCGQEYQIEDGIPNMLPKKLRN